MTVTALRRIVVSTSSLPEALAFYGELLGLEALDTSPDVARLRLGEAELMLHERPSTASDTAVAVVLAVRGLDGLVGRWAAGGGAVVDRPMDQPWGERMAVVRDPDGHLVCLVEAQ